MESNNVTLNRQLGMREGITITTGTVIGVGLFTTGANCVGIMGAGIILLTFIGLLICILPALMYAEMGAALPYAGDKRFLQRLQWSRKRADPGGYEPSRGIHFGSGNRTCAG